MHRLLCFVCAAFVALVACAGVPADVPPPYRAAGPLPEPALFGEGVVSTGEYESHPAFTPDQRSVGGELQARHALYRIKR